MSSLIGDARLAQDENLLVIDHGAMAALILLCQVNSGSTQGLRIKIGRLGKVEKHALGSDFDQYPEKPGDFLNIVTQYNLNYNIKLLI